MKNNHLIIILLLYIGYKFNRNKLHKITDKIFSQFLSVFPGKANFKQNLF